MLEILEINEKLFNLPLNCDLPGSRTSALWKEMSADSKGGTQEGIPAVSHLLVSIKLAVS